MDPFLSVVIPAYNESRRVGPTIERCIGFLSAWAPSWELLVVDDGSDDDTAAIVAQVESRDSRVRLIRSAHAGKGAAVRHGMLQASGEWRFLADADLSVDVTQIPRFFQGPGNRPPADLTIGSREAPGAHRVGEPWPRHAIGRVFNWTARIVGGIRGIQDTQCGFKLFSREAAMELFPHVSLDGFAFDVEVLLMAQIAGFTVREVPVTWEYAPGGAVRLVNGFGGFAGVLTVRLNQLRGLYRSVPRATRRTT